MSTEFQGKGSRMTIYTGMLSEVDNGLIDRYIVTVYKPSVDLFKVASNAQSSWKAHRDVILNDNIVPYITANPQLSEEEKISFLLKELGEDFQWEWDKKVLHMMSHPDEYDWFILESNRCIQALMVAYHPKQSKIEQGPIFYVDYLATAPWNRKTSFNSVLVKGLGSLLLKIASNHYPANTGYKHGFSLHSLPAAEGFYSRIGMDNLGIDNAKESLRQFEMTETNCKIFCGHQVV